jgi:hypothetical protein
MKRVYVIIRELEDSFGEVWSIEDVVSSMTKADEICTQLEATNPGQIYYWREVISSED